MANSGAQSGGCAHPDLLPHNHPFNEIATRFAELVDSGAELHQKFTCTGCGQRLTIDTPNLMFTEGDCDKCGTVTNIVETGCNYLMILHNHGATTP